MIKFIALLLFVALCAARRAEADSNGFIILDKDSYAEELSVHEHIVLFFTRDNCRPCLQVEERLIGVVRELKAR